MKATLALLSLLGVAAAQGVTEAIAPDGSYPDGCVKASDGTMWVSVLSVKAAAKRDLLQPRGGECTEGNLVVTLADGVLKDSKDRTGYIASNYQFQFDGPPQAGALSTAGYSLCSNNTLALGPTTTFYQCKSGSFWNLYDRSWAAQCEPVQLAAYKCSASSSTNNGAGGAGQAGDGQVVGTAVVTTTLVKPISDGQPQVITTEVPVPMCQIGDGQVQAHTTPCASVTAAPPAPSSPAAPVSQYSDGQIQVTPPGPPAASAPPPAAGTTAPAAPAPSAAATPASSPPSASTTLATSPKPSSSAPPAASSAPPATSDAGRVPMASMAALIIGLVAAIAFL